LRRLLIILFLISLPALANQFYKDLGFIEPETKLEVNLTALLPELEKIDIGAATVFHYVGGIRELSQNQSSNVVTWQANTIYVDSSGLTAGDYAAILSLKENNLEHILILIFNVKPSLKLKVSPSKVYLGLEPEVLDVEITANCDWQLYISSSGNHPELIVALIDQAEKTLGDTPLLITSGLATGQNPQIVKISLSLPDFKTIPTGHYDFPLILNLESQN
jgi:hypothetical protein